MNLSEEDLWQLVHSVNKRPIFKSQQDLDVIETSLQNIPFFQDLSKQVGYNHYLSILKELQYECHEVFDPKVKIGDQSTKFYYILQGKFIVLTRNILTSSDLHITKEIQQHISKNFSDLQPQGFLYPGQYFGEQVLMFDQSHTQTILPVEKSHMIVIKRDAYRRIIDSYSRKEEAEKFAFLSGVQMFSKWSAKTLRNLIPEVQEVYFIQNQLIYGTNDAVDSVYIIIEGEVQLFKTSNKNTIPIAILGGKECFGDDDILNSNRTHSAKSIGCVRLYRIFKQKFLDHIPFDYATLDYRDYQRTQQIQKAISIKNNPTMYLRPLNQGTQSDLKKSRSESMMNFNSTSPLSRITATKLISESKLKTYNTTFQISDLLRKRTFKRLDGLTMKDASSQKKHIQSQSPTRRSIQFAQSPNSSVNETNETFNRIHGAKYDRTNYLIGQMKLRSITQSTWNKSGKKYL